MNRPQMRDLRGLQRQLRALTEKSLTGSLDRAQAELLNRAGRGSFDRAALKAAVVAMREMCTMAEALIRGSET